MAEVVVNYRGITFNNNLTGSGDTYILIDIPEGLASPNIRESEFNLQGRHGISDQNSFYGKRLITLTGIITSDSQAGIVAMQNNLKTIFSLDGVQNSLNASYYPLTITDETGSQKTIDVKTSVGIEFTKQSGNYKRRDFIVTLKAKDPRFYSVILNSRAIQESFESTNFQVPFLAPFQLASNTYYIENVINSGSFNSPLFITLSGVSENPVVRNNTTGQFFKLNTNLVNGDIIEIDSSLGTVEKNGVDISNLIDDNSEFLFLEAGENEIELLDDTPAELLFTANLEWRDSFI